MIRLLVILISLSISWNSAQSQEFGPLALAEKIFAHNQFVGIESYVTGEYNGRPNGQDFPQWVTRKFRLLGENKRTAVVQMTLRDSANFGFDAYLHFKNEDKWKLAAFRALALTGIIEQTIQQLEGMSRKQIDSIIETCRDEKSVNSKCLFSSKNEYDYLLKNAKLTIAFDDTIVNHFLNNVKEFNRLKEIAEKEKSSKTDSLNFRQDLLVTHKSEYRALLISDVYTFGESGVNFLIGGIGDNSVGYIYMSNKEEVPDMGPSGYIMILEIGNGWYLYKTT